MNKSKKYYAVSEILEILRKKVEQGFENISIQGEITNLSRSPAGHYYFNLVDNNAVLSCAFFRGAAARFKQKITDGDQVIATGKMSLYSKRGNCQLIVSSIESSDKEGLLKKKIEELKKKLQSQGLFDLEIKKKIPRFPRKIAVITSPRSAAAADFVTIFSRRAFTVNLVIVPAIVQGESAPSSIMNALNQIEKKGIFDLVVITRGGGSFEDLYCFNEEQLLLSVAQFKLPVISAVGHEVDYTLLDYVSDLRCETPSACAELLTENQVAILQRLESYKRHLRSDINSFIFRYKEKLIRCSPLGAIRNMQRNVQLARRRLDRVDWHRLIHEKIQIVQLRQELDHNLRSILELVQKKQSQKQKDLELVHCRLFDLSPNSVLKRGYCFISTDKKVINNLSNFRDRKEKKFTLNFCDGSIKIISQQEIVDESKSS